MTCSPKWLNWCWKAALILHGNSLSSDMERHRPRFTRPIPPQPGLLILGYGKLGSRGLSYRSDLDLVLLQPDCSPDLLTTGPEPTPLHRFYSRVGQRLIQLLSTQTTSGRLYEVDVRLRPSGNAGPIVSELQSFIRYQLNDAHTWEHQALVHAATNLR